MKKLVGIMIGIIVRLLNLPNILKANIMDGIVIVFKILLYIINQDTLLMVK